MVTHDSSIVATVSRGFPSSPAIPFDIEVTSGRRPIVAGFMNELPYKFEVHSNAGFYLQTNHQTATIAGITQLQHTGTYGIVSSGLLSTLGRDEGILKLLLIGQQKWQNVPASVFETPHSNMIGMLGLKWIETNQLIMDFPRQLLWMRRQPESSLNEENLTLPGSQSIPMYRDEKTGRYLVDVTINAVTRPMIVSTVADLVLDTEFAEAALVASGEYSGESGGPTGAVEKRHAFEKPIQIAIGSWLSVSMNGEIEDIYGYMGTERPPNGAVGGMLGAEFLIANNAVIDFGSRRLYFPTSS